MNRDKKGRFVRTRPKWLTDDILNDARRTQDSLERDFEQHCQDTWWEFQMDHRLTDRQMDRLELED